MPKRRARGPGWCVPNRPPRQNNHHTRGRWRAVRHPTAIDLEALLAHPCLSSGTATVAGSMRPPQSQGHNTALRAVLLSQSIMSLILFAIQLYRPYHLTQGGHDTAPPASPEERVALVGTVQVLHEPLTTSLCQTVFHQTPGNMSVNEPRNTCRKVDFWQIKNWCQVRNMMTPELERVTARINPREIWYATDQSPLPAMCHRGLTPYRPFVPSA